MNPVSPKAHGWVFLEFLKLILFILSEVSGSWCADPDQTWRKRVEFGEVSFFSQIHDYSLKKLISLKLRYF